MTASLNTQIAAVQARINEITPTSTAEDVVMVAKAIEAIAGQSTVLDIAAAGESNIAALNTTRDSALATIDQHVSDQVAAGFLGGRVRKELTASGTLANGDRVALNADGSVSVVATTPGEAGMSGLYHELYTSNNSYLRALYLPEVSKVIVVRSYNTSHYAYLGDVSGTSISFGEQQGFSSGGTYTDYDNFDFAWDGDRQCLILFSKDSSQYGRGIILKVNADNTLNNVGSFSFPINSPSYEISDLSVVYDQSQQCAIAFYRGNTTSRMRYIYARPITYDGAGTANHGDQNQVYIDNGNTSYIKAVYLPEYEQTLVACYNQPSSSFVLFVSLVRLHEGVLSFFGQSRCRLNEASNGLRLCYDPSNSCALLLSRQNGISGTYAARIGISANSTQFPAALTYVHQSNINDQERCLAYNPKDQMIYFWTYGNDGEMLVLSLDNDRITLVDGFIPQTGNTYKNCVNVNPEDGTLLLAWDAGSKVRANTYRPDLSNQRAFIGLSESAVTDGAAQIALPGAVVSNLSGLVPGQAYSLERDGALTLDDTGVHVGRALSATTLLLESR